MAIITSLSALGRTNQTFRVPLAPTGKGIVGKVIPAVKIPVDRSARWMQAVLAGAPRTSDKSLIGEVEKQYLPDRAARALRYHHVLCVNFGKFRLSKAVLAWSNPEKLSAVHPRVLLAVGGAHPSFEGELARAKLLVTLETCIFGNRPWCCVVSLKNGCREAGLLPYDGGWSEDTWFVFEYQ